jgi:hypothetical protein
MLASVFWRIVWKEYRTQRGLWLVLAASAIVLQLVIVGFMKLKDFDSLRERDGWLFAVALLFTIIEALASASMLFALETEDETRELLLRLGVSARRVFASKVSVCVGATAAMLATLGLAAFAMSDRTPPPFLHEEAGQIVLVVVSFLVWGWCFSLTTRNVLTALVLAAAFGLWTLAFDPWEPVILAVVLGADVWLAGRWLRGEPLVRLRFRSGRIIQRSVSRAAATTDIAPDEDSTIGPRRRAWRRLLWCEWRAARGMLGVLLGLGCVLAVDFGIVSAMNLENTYRTSALHTVLFMAEAAPLFLLLIPLLLGLATFGGEKIGQRFRFLADRGVDPRFVWLAKHAVWLPTCLGISLLVIGLFTGTHVLVFLSRGSALIDVTLIRNAGTLWYDEPQQVVLAVLFVCLSYAVGQLAALLFARTIMAFAVSFGVSCLLVLWTVVMVLLEVPLSLSVAPIGVICLAASYLRTRDWMLDHNRPRDWLRCGATLVIPAAVMMSGVAAYRVFEIPGGGPVPPEFAVSQPITVDEAETDRLYRDAMRQLVPHEISNSHPASQAFVIARYRHSVGDWSTAPPEVVTWVAQNEAVVPRLLEATQRAQGGLEDVSSEELEQLGQLDELLIFTGSKLMSEGNLDAAWRHFHAGLRLSRHVMQRGRLLPQWFYGQTMMSGTCEWLVRWAAQPRQSPERVAQALRVIDQETATAASLADALAREYATLSPALHGKFLESEALAGFGHHQDRVEHQVWMGGLSVESSWRVNRSPAPKATWHNEPFPRWLPWDQTRARRVVGAIWRDNVAHVQDGLTAMRTQPEVVFQARAAQLQSATNPYAHWIEMTPVFHGVGDVQTTANTWLPGAINLEAKRRAALLRIGLAAWQTQHGQLPDRLDELLDDYFEQLPHDPWTGREFLYFPAGLTVDNLDGKFDLNRDGALRDMSPTQMQLLEKLGPDARLGFMFGNNIGVAAEARVLVSQGEFGQHDGQRLVPALHNQQATATGRPTFLVMQYADETVTVKVRIPGLGFVIPKPLTAVEP